jgi:Protein of unknown function (DUF1488)
MPLRATDKLEIYIFMSGAMVFYMIDENDKRRVRCSISDRALRQFEPRMEWGEQDQKRVLSAHRQAIEEIASKKYDRGQFADDGETIQILEADVPPQEHGGQTA